MLSLLRSNLAAVRARIERACRASGRRPEDVRLLPVTKYVGADVAAALVELGELELGESRVQELGRKAAELAGRGLAVRWHLIGPLQRNKVRAAVRAADVFHSVDRGSLIDALERAAGEEGRRPEVLLEVDFTGDPGRAGLAPSEVAAAVERAAAAPHLRLAGLMTLAPRASAEDPEAARGAFRGLARLATDLPARAFAGGRARLSMGMSHDLEVAVEEGADLVRVGSALFEGLEARRGSPPERGAG